MNKFLYLIFSILLYSNYFADDLPESFNTINFQGFLAEADTDVPINGTIGVTFWIHPTYNKDGNKSTPPYFLANILDSFELGSYWVEQFDKINIKDGILFQRIGVHPANRLSTSLFETRFRFGFPDQRNPPVLHLLVVPFGTNEETWIGPFNIDGTPYSVSSVATKGEDVKEGRLTIIPHPTNSAFNKDALLEVMSPGDENPHIVNICYTPKFISTSTNCPNPPSNAGLDLPISQYTGSGLVIKFPTIKSDGSDFTNFDMEPTEIGNTISIAIPQNSGVPLGTSGDNPIPDVSVHIHNGKVRLNGAVEISPFKLNDIQMIPGDLKVSDATITGEIKVNEIDAFNEIVQGDKLGSYDKSEKYKSYQIDPYVIEVEGENNLGTKVNSLTIIPNTTLLNPNEDQKSQLLIIGPISQTKTAHVSLEGAGEILAPRILSPIKDSENKKVFQVSADQITKINSLILYDYNETTNEEGDLQNAQSSPLDVDMAFDLLSHAPLCKIGLKYHQALRKDYCAGIDGQPGFDGTDPDGKYYTIDPCRGTPNSQLLGTPLSCFSDPKSPNIIEHPNMQKNGTKYLIYKAHIHNIEDNATSKMLIDIINKADPSKGVLFKDILPLTAVDSTIPQTLANVNEFRNHDLIIDRKLIVSQADGLDIFIGAKELSDSSPIIIGSDSNSLIVSEIRFSNEQYCDPNISACQIPDDPFFNGHLGLKLYAATAKFKDSVSISQSVKITGEINIEVLNGLGGEVQILSEDESSSGTPKPNSYVYIPKTLTVLQSIDFNNLNVPAPMSGLINQSDGTSFGISNIVADKFIDRNTLGDGITYLLDPSETSVLSELSIVGNLHVEGEVTFNADLTLSDSFNVNGNLTATHTYTTTFYDFDNPSFFATPHQTSYIDGMSITQSLFVSGNAHIVDDVFTTHADINNGLTIKENDLVVQQTIFGTKIQGKTNSVRQVYPLSHSVLNSLRLISNGNLILKNANLNINNGNLSHAGNAIFTTSHSSGILLNGGTIKTTSIVDFNDNSFILDPASISTFKNLSADTIEVFNSTPVTNGVTIEQFLYANKGLFGKQNLFISKDYIFRNDIKIMDGASVNFHVDQTGRISAKSLQLTSDFQLNNLEVNGSIDISGPAVEINADTNMHKMVIVTHTLRSEDLLAAGSSNPITYFTIDPDGNLSNYNDIHYNKDLTFSDTIHVTQQTGNTLQFSDISNIVTSVYIGNTANKNLLISGLSSDILKTSTGYFSFFEDRDNSTFFMSPSSFSNIQTLQLSSSLSTQDTLTSPFLLDLDNNYIVDFNQSSHLDSLEVLNKTSSEWLQTPYIHINSENQTTNTTIIALDTFNVQKNNKIIYTGTSKFQSIALSIKNTEGLIIADNFSTGSGILMTPGDLNTLINHLSADDLHRHDKIGGVSIENIARQDINNSVPASVSSSSIYRAFSKQNTFTKNGLVLSIEPNSDSSTKPLLLVRNTSSTVFSVMSTGGVHATTFIGNASGISNIGGSASTNDAIIDLSIENIKIKDNSLDAEIFTINSIKQINLKTSIFLSRHFQEQSLSDLVLKNQGILSQNLNDKIILNQHIIDGEIDGTLLIDQSIQSYHISTLEISSEQIQNTTLTGEVFAHQSITSDKILDDSIRYDHVSTSSISSIKILLDSLKGQNFSDKSVSTAKIKSYTIISSRLKSLDLTNSDFDDSSISSSKIATYTIVHSSISSSTLSSRVFNFDSIDFTKIVSASILTIDIATNTIIATALSTDHKFSDKIIESSKIIDRSIIGEHFFENSILLPHIENNTVESLQITTEAIEQSDILTKTITGESIQNLSIQSSQIDNAQIITNKIAIKVFESNSISANTLTSQSFADASIINSKIASNAIDSSQIANLTLLDEDFFLDSLILSKWQTQSIASNKLATYSITLSKLATNSVISSKILSSEIQTSALSSSQIVSSHIAPSAIVTDKIANFTINTIDLQINQIDARVIAPKSIYSTNIVNLSIINSLIPSKELTSSKFDINSVTEWKIQTNQVSTIKISSSAIESFNLNTNSLLSSHFDTEVISSRLIVDQQILTTHIINLNILNSLISDLSIDSRVVNTDAITSSLIESYILTNSDFAKFILSDSHFQSNAITNGEIQNLSISYDLFKTHTLENRHIVPQTITSNSMQVDIITSSKIKLASLSSEDILNLSITDEQLDLSALPRSVFAQNAITSANILNLTILQEDINDSAILTSHINTRAIESNHFSDFSILTTHIANFTIDSSILASTSISNGNLQTRVSDFAFTQGFHSLSDSNQLTNIQKAVQIQNGKFLIFDNQEGIFEFNSANKNTLKKIDSLTGPFTKVISIDKKVWVLVDDKFLYLSINQGEQFTLIQTFTNIVYDFYFEDEFHGVFVDNDEAWMTYDSGLTLRKIRDQVGIAGFRRIFSLNTLSNIWIARRNGGNVRIDYTSTQGGESLDSFSIQTYVGLFHSKMEFQMTSINNGQIFLSGGVTRTTDNWGVSLIDQPGTGPYDHIQLNPNSTVDHVGFSLTGQATVFPTGIPVDLKSGFNGENLTIIDVIFIDKEVWYLLFKHDSSNEISIAKTSNSGDSYNNYASFGTSDATENAYTSLHAFGNLFTINNAYRNYLSTDSGETFNAVKRSAHLTHFDDMQFVSPSIVYAYDTKKQVIVKSVDSGQVFFTTRTQTLTNPKLLFNDKLTSSLISELNPKVIITINAYFDITTHDLVYQPNDISYGFNNNFYIAGEGSNYSVVPNNTSTPVTHILTATSVNITAITSDYSTGIWFGSSLGAIYYVTSAGAASKLLTSIGEKVQDISSIDDETLLVSASGLKTIITFDKGKTWAKVLDSSYDNQLFTACHIAQDKSIFLAGGKSILLSKLGEGFENQKIADRSILSATITTEFNQNYFMTESIIGGKLSDDSISQNSYLTKALLSSLFATDSVTSVKVSSDAVSSRVIAFESITKEKIKSSSIFGDQKIDEDTLIGDDFANLGGIDHSLLQTSSFDARLFTTNNANAIQESDFATKAISPNKLDYYSFHGSKIKSLAINSNHIQNNSIFGIHFKKKTLNSNNVASGTFSVSRILAQTITSNHIIDGEIQANHFALFEYWNDQIIDLSIDESSLLSDSFTGKKFKNRAFTKVKIKNNSIIHQNILNESIDANKILTNSIELADFALLSLTNDVIKSGTINAALLDLQSIIGDFVVSYDIDTSKIDSQAISGAHIKDGVITNNKIATNTILNIDIASNTLTQSKIKTLILTDGHFNNLDESSFANDSIDTTKVRLYQSTGSTLYVSQSNENGSVFASNSDIINRLQAPSVSPDNSKVAFINSGNIYWSDIYLKKIVDTGIAYPGTPRPYLTWSSTSDGILYFKVSDKNIYEYDIHNSSVNSALVLTTTGGDKLIFAAENLTRWTTISGTTGLAHDTNCYANLNVRDLTITRDGSKIVGVSNNGYTAVCSWGSSFISTLWPSGNIYKPMIEGDSFYFFDNSSLYKSQLNNVHDRKLLTILTSPSLTSTDAKTNAFIHSAHNIKSKAITDINITLNTLDSTHLAELSFHEVSFNSAIIQQKHLQLDSIQVDHLATNTLSNDKIAISTITQQHLKDLTLTGEYFTQDSISSAKVEAQTISSSKLTDNAILLSHIAALAVTSGSIADKSILTTHLSNDLIDLNSYIKNNIVSSSYLASNAVSSFHIVAGSILTTHIINLSIEQNILALSSIQNTNLESNIFDGNHFANSVITNNKIQNNQIKAGDGIIVTIEGGDIFRYDWEGTPQGIANDPGASAWTKLQKSANGNKLSAILVDELHSISIFSNSSQILETNTTNTYQILDRLNNKTLTIASNDDLNWYRDGKFLENINSSASENGIAYHQASNRVAYVKLSGPPELKLNDNGVTTTVFTAGGIGEHIMSPSFSPDGGFLYFIHAINSSPGVVKRYDTFADSSIDISNPDLLIINTSKLRSTPSDDFVFFTKSDKNLYKVESSGNDKTPILVLNSVTNIDEFEILPYSAFAHETFTDSNVANDSITTSIWANRVLTSSHFVNSTIATIDLKDSSFKAKYFIDDAFTTAKFIGKITTSTIASRAISSRAILDRNIQGIHIKDDVLNTEHFAQNTLTSNDIHNTPIINGIKLEDLAVTGAKINNAAKLQANKIAAQSVGNNQIVSDILTSSLIKDNTLTSADFGVINNSSFATNSITNIHFLTNEILVNKINGNLSDSVLRSAAITYGHLNNNMITSSKIKDGDIDGTLISNGVITNNKITNNTILSANILDNSIDGSNLEIGLNNTSINDSTLLNIDLKVNSFNDTHFAGGAINNGNIDDLSIKQDKVAAGAINNALLTSVVVEKINGDSFSNRAFGTNEIEDATITSAKISLALSAVNIGTITLESSDFSNNTLTKSDFATTFVTGVNTANNSINDIDLDTNSIVKDTGINRLSLAALQILQRHILTNDITGAKLANSSIESANINASTLDVSKIKESTILNAKIASNILSSIDLVNNAILNVHFSENFIPSNKIIDDLFLEADVLSFSGVEILDSDLTVNKIANNTIETSDLLANSFGSSQILTIELNDLNIAFKFTNTHFANSTIINDDFADNQVEGSHFSSTLSLNKFVSSTITFNKLDLSDPTINSIFDKGNADSHHKHDIRSQTIQCTGAGMSKVGTSGNAFCIKPDISGTFDLQYTDYAFYDINNISVRGRICTAEQLWRAHQAGVSFDDLINTHSSDFMVTPKGLGGDLKMLKFNDDTPSSHSGFGESPVTDSSTNLRTAWCY